MILGWHNLLEFVDGDTSELGAPNENSARRTFARWKSHEDLKTITLVDATGLIVDTWTKPNAVG